MKSVRIKQMERWVRLLQADGYTVRQFVSNNQRRLIIHINLSPDEGDEIMTQWDGVDLRRVNGG